MLPRLGEFIANGASRHRLRKGLILISKDAGRKVGFEERSRLVEQVKQINASQEALAGYTIEADEAQPSVIHVVTPLSPVHTRQHRDAFILKLAQALSAVIQAAAWNNLVPIGVGVDPFIPAADGLLPALCADIHEIEIFDDLEVNRIYNLFRQYLPELIAVSAHSALLGGRLQKDLSTRMRLNPASFTPPSLTLFSSKQIDRLKRAVRKDYGLNDLAQLDVNLVSPNMIVLRFVDAQTSLQFIRMQILLFQAIAMHGRTLARQGSQMPILHSRIISENKALAIEAGPGAIFKPDRKREVKRRTPWYQDRQVAERASTTLLQALHNRTVDDKNTIISSLQTIRADYDELAPYLLGAELRKRDEVCLVNYGEYQLRLFHINRNNWRTQLLEEYPSLLVNPEIDLIHQYNESKFQALESIIRSEWTQKLNSRFSDRR